MGNTVEAEDSSSQGEPKCYLTTVPGEIRNNIYDHFFSTIIEPDEEVDLLTAQLPSDLASKAILLTCKNVSREVNGRFKEACRRFWTDSHFVIGFDGYPHETRLVPQLKRTYEAIDALDESTIASLTKLTFMRREYSEGRLQRTITIALRGEGWDYLASKPNDDRPSKWAFRLHNQDEPFLGQPTALEQWTKDWSGYYVNPDELGSHIERRSVRGRPLSEGEIKFVADLATTYI